MAGSKRVQDLDASKIVATIDKLSERIHNRFPDSGLHGVSVKLLQVARQAQAQADWIAEPIRPLRLGIAVLVAVILAGILGAVITFEPTAKALTFWELVGAIEAALNDVVMVGIAVFFLVSLEGRIKRHRTLAALNRLRSLAHIIDMHQLTKDPDHLVWGEPGDADEGVQRMTPYQLTRYLEYCSEMLSLVGKVCAIYIDKFDDSVTLAAVNEVEALTTGLSGKIWQKVSILDAMAPSKPSLPPPTHD
jgi:hypothetical protein